MDSLFGDELANCVWDSCKSVFDRLSHWGMIWATVFGMVTSQYLIYYLFEDDLGYLARDGCNSVSMNLAKIVLDYELKIQIYTIFVVYYYSIYLS